MFPKYCFKKNADEFNCDVMYVPKTKFDSNHHHSTKKSNASSRSRNHACSKLSYENMISRQAFRENNDRNGSTSQSPAPARNVEIRLPQIDNQRQFTHRRSGGSASAERDTHLKQQQQRPQQAQLQRESPSPNDIPLRDLGSAHILQDSCADFLHIIYENVLQAVNGAVEVSMDSHFQHIMSKVNQLKSDISVQEGMLNQINNNLMTKIAELNETNLKQFKFIAQMLIDSQTINYKALNHQRRNEEKSISLERKQRPENSGNSCHNVDEQVTQNSTQKPQHQLWQQQNLNVLKYAKSPCRNCSSLKEPERTIFRRTSKGNSSCSMPNLHQASLPTSNSINSNIKNKLQPAQGSATPRNCNQFTTIPPNSQILSKRRCHCHCHGQPPAQTQSINYLLSNNTSLGRKLRTLGKTEEDVRAHP